MESDGERRRVSRADDVRNLILGAPCCRVREVPGMGLESEIFPFEEQQQVRTMHFCHSDEADVRAIEKARNYYVCIHTSCTRVLAS